ncbi:hypothetical protein WA556_004621 [Blastocystis sp. ATCC 50177/Nand II]
MDDLLVYEYCLKERLVEAVNLLEKKDFESELAHDKSFDTSIRTRRKFFSISELVAHYSIDSDLEVLNTALHELFESSNTSNVDPVAFWGVYKDIVLGCALLENAEKEKIMGDLRIIEENNDDDALNSQYEDLLNGKDTITEESVRKSKEFLGQLIDQLELDTCGETVLEHNLSGVIDDILASVMGSPAVEWGSGARLTGREVISTSQTARRGLKRAQKAMKDPLEELQKPQKAKRVASPPSSPAFDFDASSSSSSSSQPKPAFDFDASSSSSSSSDEELEKLQQALKPTPTPASKAAEESSSESEKEAPNTGRGRWSQEEDAMILEYAKLAPDWPEIKKRVGKKLHRTARQIAGRFEILKKHHKVKW